MSNLPNEKRIGFKVLIKHSKGCDALRETKRGFWNSPWYFNGAYQARSKTGRAIDGGHHRWLELDCNSTSCHATAIIREDDLLELLPHE